MGSRKGDPSLMGYPRRRIPDDQIVSHFWSKVDKNGPVIRPELGPCWIWTAGTNGNGYGVFCIRRKKLYAHRIVCELTYGPLKDGEWVRHKCHNGAGGCVRPEHIHSGAPADNVKDTMERGGFIKDTCRRGHIYAEVGFRVASEQSKAPGKRTCKACLANHMARKRAKGQAAMDACYTANH